MDIQINCPHCNGVLSIKREWFGMGMNCPLCNQYFDTEAPAEPAETAQPQAPVPAQAPVQEEAPAKLKVANREPVNHGKKRKKKRMSVSKTGIRKKPSMKKRSDLPHHPGAQKARTVRREALQDGGDGTGTSDKSKMAAALLCWFLGSLGIHRFYLGKPLTGLLMMFTLGCLGIWTLIDFIMILTGGLKDAKDRPLK